MDGFYVFVQSLRLLIPALFSLLFRIIGLGCRGKKQAAIALIVFIAWLMLVPAIAIPWMGYPAYTKLAAPVLILGQCVVFYISTDSFLKTAFLHLVQSNVILLLSIFCNTLRHTLGLSEATMLWVLPLVYLPTFLLGLHYCAKPLRFIVDGMERGVGALMMIPISSGIAVLLVSAYSDLYFGDHPILTAAVVAAIELCCLLYVWILYQNMKEIKRLADKELSYQLNRVSVDAMERQLALTEKEYQANMESLEQIRRVRHDMNHHLSVLLSLLQEGNTAEAMDYIRQIATQIPRKPLGDQNLLTDSFVSQYKMLCQEERIRFSANIAFRENALSGKSRLGVLLGNALQNAYEAAKKMTGEQRYIDLRIKQMESNLVLMIQNGYNGEIAPNYRTTKENSAHGFGLGSIRKVVEQYQGYLKLEHSQQDFTLTILLPLQARAV